MTAIFKREFRSYFHNLTGFIFIAVFLIFNGIFITAYNLIYGYSEYEYTLSNLALILALLIPIITMRIFAEDRKMRTDKLLLSLPLTSSGIVIGKYLALLAVFAIPAAATVVSPLFLRIFGSLNFLSAYGAVLAFILLGAALISICMYVSSKTENQIIAAILCYLTLLIIYLAGAVSPVLPSSPKGSFICFMVLAAFFTLVAYLSSRNIWVTVAAGCVFFIPLIILFIVNPSVFDGLIGKAVEYVALFRRFDLFAYGTFDLSAIVLYLTLTFIFVFLTVRSVKKQQIN